MPNRSASGRAGLGVLALLAAAACGDATGPAAVASLDIAGAPGAAMEVGDTLTLTASPLDARGRAVGDRPVAWRSTTPSVASVSAGGRVTALAAGQAWVVAAAEGAADSVALAVAAPATSQGCPAGAQALSFAVGEVRATGLDARGAACLEGAAGGAEYVVVAFNERERGSVSLEALGSGLGTVAASAAASVAPSAWGGLGGTAAPRPRDAGFEAMLRARERGVLPAYVPAVGAARARRGFRASVSAAAVPAVGDLLSLNASLQACTSPATRTGRVAAVTQRAVVVADTANPAGGFTDAEYRELGLAFDTLVYPVDVANFGEPTDLDANGRTLIFFTRAVNELTERDSDSYVGGFFYARDLFPRTTQGEFEGCAGSNHAEMFYMLVPDPQGTVNGNDFTKEFVNDVSVGTIAHEMQHLISAARRLYVVGTENFDEEVWLNEGLSHVAEELVFYRAAGLAPGQNVDLARLRSSAAVLAAFNRYGTSNFGRLREYLRSPEASSPFANDDELSTRGAAWAFLRYAADRRGGDQAQVWNRLVNSDLTGLANLRAVLGTDPVALARDWTAATYADDALSGAGAAYSQPSWSFRSIFPAFSSSGGAYPLRVRTLADGAPDTVSLAAGGGAFFRVAVPAAGRGEVRLTAAGAAPTGVSVLVMRTR